MGELSSPQPLQPHPLREAARKSPKVWGGEGMARAPRAPGRSGRCIPGSSWTSPGSGESKGLGLSVRQGSVPVSSLGSAMVSSSPHGVRGTPGSIPMSRCRGPPPPGSVPVPSMSPQGWTPAPPPAHHGCHGDPNVTSAARSHNFRVCGVRAFSRRSPTPMAGPGVSGDPRPLTPHRVRDLREPRAVAEGVSPFGSGGDPGWRGWGHPGGPAA